MEKVLTEEQKKSILNDYENTKMTTAEIAVKYAISPSAVSYTVRTMGGEMRVKKRCRNQFKKCPNCYKVIKLNGARYCPYCATDIRDEKEIALERLNKLNRLLRSYPTNMADEATAIINDVVEYIKTVK